MRNSWFVIVGLCVAAMCGCATDVGAFGPDSGTNNSNPDVIVATDLGAPIDSGPRPACDAESTATQTCACIGLGQVGVQMCAAGRWSICECPIVTIDAGTTDLPMVADVPEQPVCSPPCGLDQTCRTGGVCASNCSRPCVGRETCNLLASAGWTCIDLNPPAPDAGPMFACATNETRECFCANGSRSAQTCNADRAGFGPCQCVTIPVDAGTPAPDVPFTCLTGSANCDGNIPNGCEINTTNDRVNCGACGNVCPVRANGAAICLGGRCDLVCITGFANCNGTASDGCETNVSTTVTSCGACGSICSSRDNATTTCSSGACGFTCLTGFANCDGNATNGCETDIRTSESSCGTCGNACGIGRVCSNGSCQFTCNAGDGGVSLTSCVGGATCISLDNDLANCGACGRVCPANIQAHATCMNSACGNACNTGFGDCDNLVANGCERELVSDTANCGRCGNACPARANAVTGCRASSCSFTCNTGFGDCDYSSFNGCETDVRTSTQNCGACGRSCPSGQSCSAGACVGPINPICPAGQSNCGSVFRPICLNLASDHDNCGGCGWWCYSDETCASGNCRPCPSGQLACGNVCTDVRASAANCGGCGIVCGGGQACVAGVCATPCASGQANCGGVCTSTQTDTNNCGACGVICPARPNATGIACMGGSCGYVFCTSGFGDCNGSAADGCETVLNTNSSCGVCGRICGSGTTCSGGTCVSITPVDAGTPTADTGTPADVMTAPVSCPPGFSPRTIEYRIPPAIPAGCNGTSARPVLWGQTMGEPIGTGPGTVIEPVGMPLVPLYHAPLPAVGAPLTPLPLQFTNTAYWGAGNYLEMSARCGGSFGTYYESLGFWLPYANLAAAGGSFRVNGVEMAADVVRVGNKMHYVLGPTCVPN